jgi:hypothetical protein
MVSEINDVIPPLSSWFKKYGWEVYQDQKNNNDNKIFHVAGSSTKKPDLICITPKKWVIAIEVKTGDIGKDLGKNSKLMQYYENYIDCNTEYHTELGSPLLINNFVIATAYSKDGHLKENEPIHIHKNKEKHDKLFKDGFEPKNEYEWTHTCLRRGIWDFIDKRKYDYSNVAIGALLSTKLDNNGESPAIFVMKRWNTWCHRWLINL